MKHRSLFILSPSLITAAVLRAWVQAGHGIAAVWWTGPTPAQVTRRASLGGTVFPEFDTARLLQRLGVTPRKIPPLRHWPDALAEARKSGADVLVSLITMQKIPADLIALFPDRAVNFHPALLPQYRGPSPTQGMLIDGTADRFGGVTLHCLDRDLDTGPIIAQRACPRSAARDMFEWNHHLAEAAADLAARDLPAYLRGDIVARPQDPASGSYRRLARGENELGPHLTVAEINARFSAFGSSHAQRWRDPSGQLLAVTAVAPANAGKGPLWLRRKAADGEVLLRRRTPLFQLHRMRARFGAMRRSEERAGGKA